MSEAGYKSESYKECHCGADCRILEFNDKEEPCWGEVHAVDEETFGDDWSWIHGCEGHSLYNEPYTQECQPIE